jgi:NitT/TauT family transport system permease protein
METVDFRAAAAGAVPDDLDTVMSGLDNLEVALPPEPSKASKVWAATWPKLTAVAIAILGWQLIVWSHWKPDYILPGPWAVAKAFWHGLVDGNLIHATGITMKRAATGYVASVAIGTVLGIAVAESKVLRSGIGSLITGLQTMPSTAWIPLAVALFQLTEGAIFFVIVIGSVPAIANGVISGVDNTPPVLLRAGHVLGAKGFARYRHIVLPAALPGFVAGLKQGWAFAWRSLMAGELIVIIAHRPSLGVSLQQSRELNDYPMMIAAMVCVLIIGLVMDSLFFGRLERTVLARRGLLEKSS